MIARVPNGAHQSTISPARYCAAPVVCMAVPKAVMPAIRISSRQSMKL
jgi:hypothetical protein